MEKGFKGVLLLILSSASILGTIKYYDFCWKKKSEEMSEWELKNHIKSLAKSGVGIGIGFFLICVLANQIMISTLAIGPIFVSVSMLVWKTYKM